MIVRILARDVVQQRLGNTSQELELCACEDCRIYDISEPPVWVPAPPVKRPDGKWEAMVEQLHGLRLREHLRAAGEFKRKLLELRESEQFKSQPWAADV